MSLCSFKLSLIYMHLAQEHRCRCLSAVWLTSIPSPHPKGATQQSDALPVGLSSAIWSQTWPEQPDRKIPRTSSLLQPPLQAGRAAPPATQRQRQPSSTWDKPRKVIFVRTTMASASSLKITRPRDPPLSSDPSTPDRATRSEQSAAGPPPLTVPLPSSWRPAGSTRGLALPLTHGTADRWRITQATGQRGRPPPLPPRGSAPPPHGRPTPTLRPYPRCWARRWGGGGSLSSSPPPRGSGRRRQGTTSTHRALAMMIMMVVVAAAPRPVLSPPARPRIILAPPSHSRPSPHPPPPTAALNPPSLDAGNWGSAALPYVSEAVDKSGKERGGTSGPNHREKRRNGDRRVTRRGRGDPRPPGSGPWCPRPSTGRGGGWGRTPGRLGGLAVITQQPGPGGVNVHRRRSLN